MASRPGRHTVREVTSKKKAEIDAAATLQRVGQNAYKVGDLQGALQSFTQALVLNGEDASILDNRAATHCRLKLYSQARTDARAMVKLAPNDDRTKGYLRLAKVLCLDGKFDKAQEIYEYALKKLPADHSGRKVVTQLLKKLQDKLAGGNRRDPFSALPLEVAVLTLQCFSFKQIVAILRVCKGWSRFISGLSSLWMHIDLLDARSRVPWTSVRNYIHRSRAQLTHATIANIVPSAAPKVLDMLSRCTELEHLKLMVPHDQPNEFYLKIKREFRQLKSITCGPDISLSEGCVGDILSTLSNLEKAAFFNVCDIPTGRPRPRSTWPQHLPNMKSLTIASSQENANVLSFPSIIPEFTSGSLGCFGTTRDPARTGLIRCRWMSIFPPPYTRTLGRGCPAYLLCNPSNQPRGSIDPPRSGNSMLMGGDGLPNLETLVFDNISWVNHFTLILFLIHSKAPLRSLHVNLCYNIRGEEFISLLEDSAGANPELRELTEVGVVGMSDLEDGNVEKLWALLPKLRTFNLSETRITGCTIRMFADARNEEPARTKLESLVIKGCDGVSRDAIDYGRQMGLNIVT
ncbi:Tetratricopeptide-like helical [Penicillium coprophilum]|uniref:Tetratricopeptide-like helical n=1 Tax=Penicillium coprophilum TaxID=36646 RepID=UPI0023A66972|nr:Tetratricopeptide-like helical [Penicillium coprophilum]KAJ5177410.1 Tetratricopeptide-like helical [Penicillium coprophilum]